MANRWRSKGGFTGTVESLTFEKTAWPAKNGKKAYGTLSAKFTVLKDGAEKAVEQYSQAGFAYESQKPKGAKVTDQIDGDSDFAKLVDSIEVAGGVEIIEAIGESNFLDFSPIVGQRYDFRNVQNVERQLASGRKNLGIVKADGFVGKDGTKYTEDEIMEAGKRKDKKDKKKSYNQNFLTITKVYGVTAATESDDDADEVDEEEEAAPAAKSAKGGKANGASKVSSVRSGPVNEERDENDEEVEEEESDVTDKQAAKFLKAILADEDGEISRKDLTLLVASRIKNRGERDSMLKKLYSTALLRQENGWSFNESSKQQTITLD